MKASSVYGVFDFASFCHGFTGFFHCPGKNSFCLGKNPTMLVKKDPQHF